MTEPLYHHDGYIREFQAEVVETLDNGVVLGKSAFYPGGGGQPSDTGVLRTADGEYRVSKISRKDGKAIHGIEGDPPPVGTRVTGVVDWDRRYKLMRTHTALHILCGVIWRDYGAQVTGGDMQPLRARMDFELENMSVNFAREVEEKINAEVAASRPVTTQTLPRDEAMRIPDLIRTKINLLPPAIKQVRIVDLNGLDIQADGGTHVARTNEVGRIRVVGHESKGRINKRLRIEVEEKPTGN